MDGITWSDRSEQGCKHLIVLRDVASGAYQLIPLYRKNDITTAFREWITSMRNDTLYKNDSYPVVSQIVTDNESTWDLDCADWNDMIDEVCCDVRYVCPDRHAEENGYAESSVRTIEIMVKQILMSSSLPASWWQYAAADCCFLLNRFVVASEDISGPSDGDRARPIELMSKGRMSRRMCDRSLSYYIQCGTPALVHDADVRGSSIRPKVRWGVACGMYREQPIWMCPFSGAKFRSKSCYAYRLKSGVNYAQLLKLPPIKSSRRSIAIPEDIGVDVTVKLPVVKGSDGSVQQMVFSDETEATQRRYKHRAAPTAKAGGTVRILDEAGQELFSDKSDGHLFYPEPPRTMNPINVPQQQEVQEYREQEDEEESDDDCIDAEKEADRQKANKQKASIATKDKEDKRVSPDTQVGDAGEPQEDADFENDLMFKDHTGRIRRSKRIKDKVNTAGKSNNDASNINIPAPSKSPKADKKRKSGPKSKRSAPKRSKVVVQRPVIEMDELQPAFVDLITMPNDVIAGFDEKLHDNFNKDGWTCKKCTMDPCLFYINKGEDEVIALIYTF